MLLVLDLESYYDKEYSLKKMTPAEYICDPRFEAIMLAAAVDDGPQVIFDGPEIPAFLARLDPAKVTTVTYNALFDNAILAWRYGFVPHRMLDAMGMARALRGHVLPGASLDAVGKFLDCGEKGGFIKQAQGLHRADLIAQGLWPQMAEYCKQDNEICRRIFRKLIPEFPVVEQEFMDMVLRACIEPKFQLDRPLLEAHLKETIERKNDLLAKAGIAKETVMSTPKFKTALEAFGIDIEYKMTKAGNTPCFAKTDEFMEELCNHDDPVVQAMAEARLSSKSTLEETRCTKMLAISKLQVPHTGQPLGMPVPLRYGGPHTTRLSGEWKLNMQNLPRGGKLRNALIAPSGYAVLVADLAQIEARLVAFLCGCLRLLRQFASGEDVYASFASDVFGFAVNKKEHPIQRFIGKTGVLGLGYACGADRFFNMVMTQARLNGIDIGALFDAALALKTVGAFRHTYHEIPNGWGRLNNILDTVWQTDTRSVMRFGPCVVGYGTVVLPNGLQMNYDVQEPRNGEHWFKYGRRYHKLYGAKFLENIVQALARVILSNASLRIRPRVDPFAHQVHDELIYLVPENRIDELHEIVHSELVKPPSWALDLPLAAEVGVGKSYGTAK